MKGQALRHCSGQAVIELAIFGAIIIFVLGAIIRSAVSSGQGQDASLKAMRNALVQSSKSTPGDTSRISPSMLYLEDRLSPDFGKYGSTERAPFTAQGSGSMTNLLMYPMDMSELQDPRHVPVMDMFINGKHFTFSMARLVYKRFLGSSGGPVHSAKAGLVETTTYVAPVSFSCPEEDPGCEGPAPPVPIVHDPPQRGGWDSSCKSGRGCPIFYQTVVNMEDGNEISEDASDEIRQEALEKRFCVSSGQCPGLLTGPERFDLNHDDNLSNDPPSSLYANMTWQWRGVQAMDDNEDDGKPLHIDADHGSYPSFDVDGDGQEETIYQVDYNDDGIATGAVVFDSQEGDLDMTSPDAAVGKVGLLNDMAIYTKPAFGSAKGNHLLINQGKAYDLDGKFIRSVNRKDQVDLVERKIQLSNDTGRMCGGIGVPSEVPAVEVCGGCFSVNNIARTCFDSASKILYVRSRMLDQQGHFWKTDASGQLRLGGAP
ncbi:MAG: hypothetical protein Q7K71_04095 [Candidatus Omnitrophota bacterium]|nr:hypothetical protein [Candidatus Omnitrophota bacterium]